MQNITFDSGDYREYFLNGDEKNVIKINVSDLNFYSRFKQAMKDIEALDAEFKNRKPDSPDVLAEIDGKARGIINRAFDDDICSKAFGAVNCFSIASNGKPIILNFVEAMFPVVAEAFKSAATAQQIKLEERTDKYIKPAIKSNAQPTPFVPYSTPVSSAIDLSTLSAEQKDAILRELLK